MWLSWVVVVGCRGGVVGCGEWAGAWGVIGGIGVGGGVAVWWGGGGGGGGMKVGGGGVRRMSCG